MKTARRFIRGKSWPAWSDSSTPRCDAVPGRRRRPAVEIPAGGYDGGDLLRVADIAQRVVIEQHDVGGLSRLDRTEHLPLSQEFRGIQGGRAQRL